MILPASTRRIAFVLGFAATLLTPTVRAGVAAKATTTAAVEKLAHSYYKAIGDEDLKAVAKLLYAPSKEELNKSLLSYAVVFQATDVKINSTEVTDVQLDKAGDAAGAFVTVDYSVSNDDGTDSYRQQADYVLIARHTDDGWKAAKVMRAADYRIARKMILYERQLQQIGRKPTGHGQKHDNGESDAEDAGDKTDADKNTNPHPPSGQATMEDMTHLPK